MPDLEALLYSGVRLLPRDQFFDMILTETFEHVCTAVFGALAIAWASQIRGLHPPRES
jgi:hypothetical protein